MSNELTPLDPTQPQRKSTTELGVLRPTAYGGRAKAEGYTYFDVGTIMWTPHFVARDIYRGRRVDLVSAPSFQSGPQLVAPTVLLVGVRLFEHMQQDMLNWEPYIRSVGLQQIQLFGMEFLAVPQIPDLGFEALGPATVGPFARRIAFFGEADPESFKTYEQRAVERLAHTIIEADGKDT